MSNQSIINHAHNIESDKTELRQDIFMQVYISILERLVWQHYSIDVVPTLSNIYVAIVHLSIQIAKGSVY